MSLVCFDCRHSFRALDYQPCPECGSLDVQERELVEAVRR